MNYGQYVWNKIKKNIIQLTVGVGLLFWVTNNLFGYFFNHYMDTLIDPKSPECGANVRLLLQEEMRALDGMGEILNDKEIDIKYANLNSKLKSYAEKCEKFDREGSRTILLKLLENHCAGLGYADIDNVIIDIIENKAMELGASKEDIALKTCKSQ